jgi:hypothetical protein
MGRKWVGNGAVVWQHKTATPGRNPPVWRRYGGDRLNHPRYRDFATIPEAVFFQ